MKNEFLSIFTTNYINPDLRISCLSSQMFGRGDMAIAVVRLCVEGDADLVVYASSSDNDSPLVYLMNPYNPYSEGDVEVVFPELKGMSYHSSARSVVNNVAEITVVFNAVPSNKTLKEMEKEACISLSTLTRGDVEVEPGYMVSGNDDVVAFYFDPSKRAWIEPLGAPSLDAPPCFNLYSLMSEDLISSLISIPQFKGYSILTYGAGKVIAMTLIKPGVVL